MKLSTLFFGKLLVFLLLLLQSILIPFFPLYLKYLNFSLLQMGVVRALMMWIPVIFTPISIIAIKKITSNITRRVCITGSIFTTLAICICFIFVAPIEHPKSVTHCKTAFVHTGSDYYTKINPHSILENISESIFSMLPKNTSNNYNEGLKIFKNYPSIRRTMTPLSEKESSEQTQTITKKINHKEGMKKIKTKCLHANHCVEKRRVVFESDKNLKEKKMKFNKNTDYKDKEITDNSLRISHPDQQSVVVNNDYRTLLPYFGLYKKSGKKPLKLANSHQSSDQPHRGVKDEIYNMKYNDDTFNKQETLKSNIYHNKRVNENTIQDKVKEGKNYEKTLYALSNSEIKVRDKQLYPIDNINKSLDIHIGNNFSVELNNQLREEVLQHKKQKDTFDLREQHINTPPAFQKKENSLGPHVVESIGQVFGSQTFLTVLVLSLLYEILFSLFIPWIEVLCCYNIDEYDYEYLLISQMFIFKSPGLILSYPIVSFLTTISPCPYQIVMHPFMGVIILVLALITALLFLLLKYPETKYFRSRKPSKPLHLEKHLMQHSFHKFFSAVTHLLLGICIASHAEFILWKAEALEGFPFNYEYLYCGYFSINAFSYICTDRYLKHQKQKDQNSYEEEDSEDDESVVHFSYEWFMNTKQIIYTVHQKSNLQIILGTFLLSATLFASSTSSVWFLLPIAFLRGLADATIESAIPEGKWMLVLFGYGFGCGMGSLTSHFLGIDILFYACSACMLTCFAAWFIYSVLYWALFSPSKGKERSQQHYKYYSI